MNFNRVRSWPHPVVSPLCDDVSPNAFDFRLDILPEYQQWILGVEVTDDDVTLARHIQTGKARYLLHVECKRTNFRGTFMSGRPRFEMSIKGDLLFGTVEASLLVVAVEDLANYQHPGQHEDYRNSTFDIAPGEPLAVAASKSFDAFLEADPILKLSSILDIRKGDNDLPGMKVNCSADRIIVDLPPTEFARYRELRADPSIRGLLATTVVLPALLDAFFYLRTLGEELDEFKADHRWCRCVIARLERLNIDLVNPNTESGICLEAVQTLLREPLKRELEDLSQLFTA
jgi:hypothetical protein